MLVISRRKQESIKISHNITITIERITGDKVRIGVDAPKDVPVVRSELVERKETQ